MGDGDEFSEGGEGDEMGGDMGGGEDERSDRPTRPNKEAEDAAKIQVLLL